MMRFQPWRCRILSHIELRPLRRDPVIERLREMKPALQCFLVHGRIVKKDGRINVNDDLRAWIDLLGFPNEADIPLDILIHRIRRAAEYERQLRYDIELFE